MMNKRILIVDDNKNNVMILQEVLYDEYELETAESGEECLEKLKQFGPDIVLLDIMMPGIDGYETCHQIKSLPYGELTQVILLSSKSSRESRLKGYGAGADDYITKPFDHDELLAKLKVQFRLRETLMELAATRAKLAIHNNQLENLVHQRTIEVVESRDITVFALAKLAESRDPETGEHLERMRIYSQILATQLGKEGPYTHEIDEAFLENIYRSSPLHDIGKVGIPDVILLKPGRLSASEFKIMQRHTTIGENALNLAAGHSLSGGFLAMAADIAKSHHERFDGSGYPNGIAGQDIPLSSRIVAVADVYDALTSIRVYKEAFDPQIAQSMILEEEGKHFDPAIVEAFQACWDEFLNVRKEIVTVAGLI